MKFQKFRDICERATSSADILTAVDKYLNGLSVETRPPKVTRRYNDSEMTYWSDLFQNEEELQRKQREEEEEVIHAAGRDEETSSKETAGQFSRIN